MVFSLFLLAASALGDVLFHFGSSFGQTYVNKLEDKTKIAVNGKTVEIDEYDAVPTDRGIYMSSPLSRVSGFPNDVTTNYDEITSEFSMAMWYFNVQSIDALCYYRYIKNGISISIWPYESSLLFFYNNYNEFVESYFNNSNFYLEFWVFISMIVSDNHLKIFLNNILQGSIELANGEDTEKQLIIGSSYEYDSSPSFFWYYFESFSIVDFSRFFSDTQTSTCFFEGCESCNPAVKDPFFKITGCLSTLADSYVNNKNIPCDAQCVSNNVGCLYNKCLLCSIDSCPQCQAGTYSEINKRFCLACPAGTYSSTLGANDISFCSNCPAGTYSSTSGATDINTCLQCQAGTYSSTLGATDKTSCLKCPVGTYSSTLGGNDISSCLKCPAGTHSSALGATDINTCLKCQAGTYSATDKSSCIQCPAGKYSSTLGAADISSCLECPFGTYSSTLGATNINTCLKCQAGTYSSTLGATDKTSCLNCPAGTYSNALGATDINTCLKCQAGTYSSTLGATDISTCLKCQAGTYSATDKSSCIQCQPGTFSSTLGATDINSCFECPVGTFSATDSSSCIKCQPGTYRSTTGGSSINDCIDCQPGYYCQSSGSSSQTACPIGFYCPTHSSTPVSCPIKTVGLTPGLSSSAECTLCTDNCLTCASTTCTQCAVGYTLMNAVCVNPCIQNKYKICVNCIDGYYLDSNKKCQQCASNCEKCVFQGCYLCKGTLSLVNGICITCPTGCATCISKSMCRTCVTGYYLNGFECSLCPPNCSACISFTYCTRCRPHYKLSIGSCI